MEREAAARGTEGTLRMGCDAIMDGWGADRQGKAVSQSPKSVTIRCWERRPSQSWELQVELPRSKVRVVTCPGWSTDIN